jgi:energy-coupling factor transport system substrate-specific component
MQKSRLATLVITSIAINYSLGTLVTATRLPIFVDSVGTVLAAIMGGFIPSLIVGVLTLIIRGLTDAPVAPAFAGTAVIISTFTYLAARRGLFSMNVSSPVPSIIRIALLGVMLSPLTSLSAAPIAIYLFGGIVPNALWSGLFTFYKFSFSLSDIAAGLLTSITVEPVDKIPTLILAAWIANSLPKRLLANYPSAIVSLGLGPHEEVAQ